MSLNIPLIAANAVALAFSTASSLQASWNYVQNSASYDPASGAVTNTSASTAINPIFLGFDAKEIDGQRVRFGDQIALIQASELTGVTPSLDDLITKTGEVDREIVGIDRDTTGTLFRIHVREKTS